MNPAGMMQFMAAMNNFKNNHPKFASFSSIGTSGGMMN